MVRPTTILLKFSHPCYPVSDYDNDNDYDNEGSNSTRPTNARTAETAEDAEIAERICTRN